MSARTQLQSKPVADLRVLAESLGINHKGLQKAKLIDALLKKGDDVISQLESSDESKEEVVAEVVDKGDSSIKSGEERSGLLDILPEGYGFMRCSGYKPSEEDVYVPAGVVKKFRLRRGDLVEGPIRPPRSKEKYPALLEPKKVNDGDPELLARRPDFNK